MFSEELDWTPKQNALKSMIRSRERWEDAIDLALEMHSVVHFSEMSSVQSPTYADEVWEGLTAEQYSIMPTKKDVTIAWNFWHITRIEDLVANLLINGSKQILDDTWLERLGVSVRDTGNTMSDAEIIALSKQLDKDELKNYSNEVGRQTQIILHSLTFDNIKCKPTSESLEQLVAAGGLIQQKGSIWLKEFWGNKTIGGLILLPITRHHVMHLNDCIRLKKKIKNCC